MNFLEKQSANGFLGDCSFKEYSKGIQLVRRDKWTRDRKTTNVSSVHKDAKQWTRNLLVSIVNCKFSQ